MVNLRRLPRQTRHQGAAYLTKLALALPDPIAYGIARGLCPLVQTVHPAAARVPQRMKRALGDELDGASLQRLTRRHFEHLSLTFVEIFRLSQWSTARIVAATELVGTEHIRAARALGQGVVIVTGHLGNWELAAAAMSARDYPVALVAKPQRSSFLEERLAASRRKHGVEVIQLDNPRACFEWLKRGGGVSLAVDQRIRNGGIEVPFFGRLARVHTGPATLALRTGAPVLLVSSRRIRPGRHEIRFQPLSVLRTGDRRRDIHENTVLFQKALEDAIRQCPEQWIWEYRMWRRGLKQRRTNSNPEAEQTLPLAVTA